MSFAAREYHRLRTVSPSVEKRKRPIGIIDTSLQEVVLSAPAKKKMRRVQDYTSSRSDSAFHTSPPSEPHHEIAQDGSNNLGCVTTRITSPAL